MSKRLSSLLRREQLAFLGRDRVGWEEHLQQVRGFLGAGLRAADPTGSVLILGAGSGLEVPWALAPPDTTGWDADPWSRIWTALRHRRWPPWRFEDLTGGVDALVAAAQRAGTEPWSGRRWSQSTAAIRLAGLLPSLRPDPVALRRWIQDHRPDTILVANVMGQFGVVAERLVESALGLLPWESDPERGDPLAAALDDWTRRVVLAFLEVLGQSGANLWLVHDRAVLFQGARVSLGPWTDAWVHQVQGAGGPLEASDPLAGLDVASVLAEHGRIASQQVRWLWPLAPGQQHLVEALAFRRP